MMSDGRRWCVLCLILRHGSAMTTAGYWRHRGFFFSSRRRHTRYIGDWSSDVCSSDLDERGLPQQRELVRLARPQRAERDHLRVDVQPGSDAEDLEEHVVDEPDDIDQRDQADRKSVV